MLYSVLLFLIRPFYYLFFRIKFHGKENIPQDGRPFIICANHISAHDIVFLALMTKKNHINFVAKEEIVKNPIIRFFALSIGVIPIKRGKADLAALRKSVDVLKNGGILGIFPQGTRYRGEKCEVSQFKSGVGMISYRGKADILPVYINAKGNRVKFFRRIDVYCGAPVKYEELGFASGKYHEFDNASEIIAEHIISLCPENDKK